MKTSRIARLALLGIAVLALASPAASQDFTITAPAPLGDSAREFPRYEAPRDVPYAPAFIGPLSVDRQRGIAVWIVPNQPASAAGLSAREVPGFISFGFAWMW